MQAFSFISIGYFFIDLSSCIIEKFALGVALEVATRKVGGGGWGGEGVRVRGSGNHTR